MDKIKRHSKKVLIGITGGLVVLVGLVLVPYPGPGWLVVFAGLAILATEFAFASRLLEYGRKKYDAWIAWIKKQGRGAQILILIGMGIVIIATIWLVNGFGLIVALFSLPFDWLVSPLFR